MRFKSRPADVVLRYASTMLSLIRQLRYAQINSNLGRLLLSFYYKDGSVHRVPLGPLRGCRLYYDRSVNFHAIIGLWDLEGFGVLKRVLVECGLTTRPCVVADVGANLGLISLWLSRLVLDGSKIYAFEPAPAALALLKCNLLLNDTRNVEVVPLACSHRVGEIEFHIAEHHHCSSLIRSWAHDGNTIGQSTTLQTTTLDTFFYHESREGPDFIKMDIEGGGVYALEGCHLCFERKRPLCFIESHTPEEDAAIGNVLIRHQYHAFRINNRRWVTNPETTHPDPDGVWGNLLLVPKERTEQISRILAKQTVLIRGFQLSKRSLASVQQVRRRHT